MFYQTQKENKIMIILDMLPLKMVEEGKVDFLTSTFSEHFSDIFEDFLEKDLVVEAEEGEEQTIEVQI